MSKKILLVEDDELIIKMYKSAFTLHGYQIDLARDGKIALQKLSQPDPKYDLIILDLILPKLDGINVLKEIRKETSFTRKSPVFILSNLGMPDVVQEAMKSGADKFFLKINFTPKQIINEVEAFLGETKNNPQP